MKTISRRICGVLLGLGVLGLIVPVVRADDMADWWAERQRQDEECRRKAQEEREAADRAYQQAQQEQAARDRAYYEAQQEQAARDRAYYEAQQEQAARAKADYEAQQQREAQDKAQADRESWDKYWRDVHAERAEQAAWWEKQRQGAGVGGVDEPRERGLVGGGIGFQGPHTWPASGPGDPESLRPAKMAPEDQEKVRQQATQIGPANHARATDHPESIRALAKVARRSGERTLVEPAMRGWHGACF